MRLLVKCVPSIYEALGSRPGTSKTKIQSYCLGDIMQQTYDDKSLTSK